MTYRVEVSVQVNAFQADLGPTHRRMLKKAILALAQERGDIKALV